jgi:hypothetical protein
LFVTSIGAEAGTAVLLPAASANRRLSKIYELRNGTGIGVFAPQFGPRRGFFGGLSQKF